MLRFTLLSTFFLCAYGATLPFVPHFDERIVGGETVLIEEFPFHVGILNANINRCGGSIIKEGVIVTAAGCTIFPVSMYKIRAGSSFPNSGGQVVDVTKYINHKEFNFKNDYDISLVFLTTELTFGATVAPVSLPAQGQHVADDSNSVTIGWGTLFHGGPYATQLQKVTVSIVNQQKCADSFATNVDLPPVTKNMICAGNFDNGGQDACMGDAGGSLTINNVLIGITSWGWGCAAPKFPGVWTRVPNYITWINNNIN